MDTKTRYFLMLETHTENDGVSFMRVATVNDHQAAMDMAGNVIRYYHASFKIRMGTDACAPVPLYDQGYVSGYLIASTDPTSPNYVAIRIVPVEPVTKYITKVDLCYQYDLKSPDKKKPVSDEPETCLWTVPSAKGPISYMICPSHMGAGVYLYRVKECTDRNSSWKTLNTYSTHGEAYNHVMDRIAALVPPYPNVIHTSDRF